jgi:leader peptidase (prepilin peptidase)/N-methyltransferase
METTLVVIASVVMGLVIGSFLTVVVDRVPRGASILAPPSACGACGNRLTVPDLVPVVSYLALRGRCRGCGQRISFQYPLVEIIVGLVWMGSYLHFGLTFTAGRVAVLITVLIGIAITDMKRYLIPDGFTLFGLGFALTTSVVAFFRGETMVFATPYDALVGACAGAGMIAIVGWLGEVMTKREAMGLGDVTLMAFVGAAVGPTRALITVFLGAAIGAVAFAGVVIPIALLRRGHAREQTELALGASPFETPLVPFGVFLAPAALLTLFWGDALLAWLTRA